VSDQRQADSLGLDPAEMRRLGYWVVDRVIEHMERDDQGPAVRESPLRELLEALDGPPPQSPGDPLVAMQTLVDVALGNMQHGDHPRYFARVPGPSSFAGVLGDWLGTGFNAISASWAGGSGPATAELVVLGWLRTLLGLAPDAEGVLTSGGSLANLMGLIVARKRRGSGVAYLCDQTHASIERGLVAIGFTHEQIRILPSDDCYRMSPEAVADAVAQDRRNGLRPGFVIATVGTTNTGAVDQIGDLARICAEASMWLHVDGAYGAPAALCPRARNVARDLERADSIVLDPHKWLFQPYDLGCLWVREPGALTDAFAMTPEYLTDASAALGEVDFRDRTLELSRRARALKLWLMFHIYGLEGIQTGIARGIALAEYAERTLSSDERWEVVTPAQLGIVTFALRGADAAEHAARSEALARDGYAAVTATSLRGRSVLRICTINPRTTERDIDTTLDRLATIQI
jgi:aromatic-L-amino-acid/L-tryptophan decarboxylase